MDYYKLTRDDCLKVATDREKAGLVCITNHYLLKILAFRWCGRFGYKLGGYLGNDCWDATRS